MSRIIGLAAALAKSRGQNTPPEGEHNWRRTCRDCDVVWHGPPPCWVCGKDVLYPSEERENARDQEVSTQ